MEFTYSITTVKCQFCVGKTHCAACSAEAEESLRRCAALEEVSIDLSRRLARIRGRDEEAVLDALDEAGLLVG